MGFTNDSAKAATMSSSCNKKKSAQKEVVEEDSDDDDKIKELNKVRSAYRTKQAKSRGNKSVEPKRLAAPV